MSIKALQEYTRISKYSRYIPEKKRRETWQEQVNRVWDMHNKKFGTVLDSIKEDVAFAKEMMMKKKVLGSQRALQFGGDPLLKHQAKIYNCSASYIDRPRVFQELLYLLLCGCGCGFSVQTHHIDKLPNIQKRVNGEKTYTIPDSIEGWADALGVLMSSYFIGNVPFNEYSGYKVNFDYSLIRPEGSPLSWGGKAPGPNGLKRSLEIISNLIEERLESGLNKLRPIDAYDIIMHSSDAVLSGGIRRSATICLFSPDDIDMATAKTGDWFIKNPQRGRSNNSALLLRNKTTKEQFSKLFTSVKEFGEPGFIWSDDTEALFNPCCEIALYAYDDNGKSGFHFCNLTEINIKKCKTEEEFYEACRASAIIGTLQASYSSIPYLGEVTENIIKREALLGCSMTGMMDRPEISFNPEIQKKGAQIILDTNDLIAKKIGINNSARTCTIKPSGTTSCLLGSSSGIHPHHAKRYFRRVQANKLEAPAQYFKAHNPRAVEISVWSPSKTDMVLTFLCEVPEGAKTKNDTSAIDLLDHVKLTQQNWIEAGTRIERCAQKWLRHNVSNTINVKPEEWDQVEEYIYNNRQYFAGISLIPMSGDLDYPQAPFTQILDANEILKEFGEGALLASGLIVDGLHAFDDNLWAACDSALGIGENVETAMNLDQVKLSYDELTKIISIRKNKVDWIRRFKQFADRYCEGNLRRCSHMLKHVHNYKLWLDLKREYVDVDWELFLEDDFKVDVTTLAGASCAGGKCDIV